LAFLKAYVAVGPQPRIANFAPVELAPPQDLQSWPGPFAREGEGMVTRPYGNFGSRLILSIFFVFFIAHQWEGCLIKGGGIKRYKKHGIQGYLLVNHKNCVKKHRSNVEVRNLVCSCPGMQKYLVRGGRDVAAVGDAGV
jgi:hypothetical protein